MEDYLEHHGVRGMKWGVRRYQNYDGSLTAAGVKRFQKSLGEYEKADARYKQAKADHKAAKRSDNYSDTAIKKGELTNAKLNRKMKKTQLEKDYRHLKQDKLADQGKKLYASGKTITGNSEVTGILNTIGSVALSAAAYNAKSGGQVTKLIRQYTGVNIDDKQFQKVTGSVGVAALGTSAVKKGVDEYQNKRLRAYYGHTSKY
jgi:hypothetical protein